jgi:hypothetical protein
MELHIFIFLILILTILAYFFIRVIQLSITVNDLRYFIERPRIPFDEKKDFPYLINSPSKNLL